jgi:hypothetical protein
VFDVGKPAGADLIGRFDFTIDYTYYDDGDGDLQAATLPETRLLSS